MALRGGRYELLGVIAAGGMASVHLGRVLGAGGFERLVAVKTMHPHLALEAEFVAMFLDEARLAARIRHPNVVGTLDIQQDDDGLFLVMELVEGPSLSHLLKGLAKQGGKMPIEVALRIGLDLLAGLHAAHELTGPDGEPLRLIHRDMSPHNVLVGADGISKITDFGVARAESRLATTRTGSVKGKVMYMPPEQVRSEAIDRRADVYAAGVVIWEMLTGARLIRGDSDLAMMRQIIDVDRRSAHVENPAVPEAISVVCARAIERTAELRFATTAAFAEALEKAISASGIQVATPRAVGALVREVGVHHVPTGLPPISTVTAPSAPRSPLASVSAVAAISAVAAAPAVELVAGPDAGACTSYGKRPAGGGAAELAGGALTGGEVAPPTTETRSVFSSSASLPKALPPRSRKGLFVAGALVPVVAAAAWWVFGRGPAAGSGNAPAAADAVSAVSAVSATPPSTAAVLPSLSASAAAPTPAITAAATASAQPTAAPSVTAASPVARPTAPPRPAATTGAGKAYRPKEL